MNEYLENRVLTIAIKFLKRIAKHTLSNIDLITMWSNQFGVKLDFVFQVINGGCQLLGVGDRAFPISIEEYSKKNRDHRA